MKVLDISNCADTIVGNGMLRGISGGQKRRVSGAWILQYINSRGQYCNSYRSCSRGDDVAPPTTEVHGCRQQRSGRRHDVPDLSGDSTLY